LSSINRSTAVAARDDALLAWLESGRTVEPSQDRVAAESPVVETADKARRDSIDAALDAALEGLAPAL
jgi:hypothetical protein